VPLIPATVAPPQNPYFSISRTCAPQRLAPTAAASPAAPAPTTHTSGSAITGTDWAGTLKDFSDIGSPSASARGFKTSSPRRSEATASEHVPMTIDPDPQGKAGDQTSQYSIGIDVPARITPRCFRRSRCP